MALLRMYGPTPTQNPFYSFSGNALAGPRVIVTPRQIVLMTTPHASAYVVGDDVRAISQCWIRLSIAADAPLFAVSRGDFEQGIFGAPSPPGAVPQAFFLNEGTLHLWPIPTDAYELHFLAVEPDRERELYETVMQRQQEATRHYLEHALAGEVQRWANSSVSESTNRSFELLKEWLDPAQLADFNKMQSFDVVGSHTGDRYRITRGSVYNVFRYTSDGRGYDRKFCFVPIMGDLSPPVGDVMLAQKIMLETRERDALKIANQTDHVISI